ncbi:MAG: nickel/cobalt transporter (NiCoT) family protein [Candidatus Eremiobacteraeota bacterium]|jgi:high-affinity nickel-transport protein|nr:nickel/cobalt transporter (NiCoT) family protein [Candidatus Eremiobacteraeota bacterium]
MVAEARARTLLAVFDDAPANLRAKIVAISVLLAGMTGVVWALALIAFATRPLLLGTALLAYTFGLRHAVDADHISAIDNVTRKLMQEGKQPVSVGLFFSLGHSTIVVALSLAIAVTATVVAHTMPQLQAVGGMIGTSVSAAFLYVIALLNLLVLIEIVATFRRVRRGEPYCERTLDAFLADRGLMGRFFKPLLRSVGRSWHMYPIGVLFGLGFDTATEVGLLGIAAVEGTKGLPIFDILLFPLLFTAGMSLLDTADGILMLGAYGWAYVKPIRKIYYNMTITLVSVLVALLVGTVEVLSVLGGRLHLHGAVWERITGLGGNFGLLGFGIVGVFAVAWLLSTLVYRARGYDKIEATAVPVAIES